MFSNCSTEFLKTQTKKCDKFQSMINKSYILGQLWTVNEGKFINKANSWISNDEWQIRGKETTLGDTFYYIMNLSKEKVLGFKDNAVLEMDFEEKDATQKWKMVSNRTTCYYSLKNIKSGKVLTAVNEFDLKMKGKY